MLLMTVPELKEHILKNMTADEALDKFLQTSIDHYEQLKTEPQFEGNPLFIMLAASWDLGWDTAIEKNAPDDLIRGIAFGTEEYLNTLLSNPISV